MKNLISWFTTNLRIIIFLLMLVGVGLFTQFNQSYYLYLLENNNVFLYDWTIITDRLAVPGGGAFLIAALLTQFFHLPYVGALVTTLCYGLMAWASYRIISKLYQGPALTAFVFLPIVFLILSLENTQYRYQGHIAFLLVVLAVWVYISIPQKRWVLRWTVGMVISACLYWFAGSATWIFVIVALLMDLFRLSPKAYLSILYLPVMALLGIYAYYTAVVPDWHYTFTPLMYYDMLFTYYFQMYAWGLCCLLVVLAALLKYIPFKMSIQRVIAVGGGIFVVYLLFSFYSLVHTHSIGKNAKQQYYTEQEDWQEVVKLSRPGEPVNFISYLNLALAKQNQLIDKLFIYNQQIPVDITDEEAGSRTGLIMAAYVSHAWGSQAGALKHAFDANLNTMSGYHPKALQLLVQHNLIIGADEVAEKYISMLEKMLFYRQWANDYRRFLDRPDLVDADPTLGNLKRSLPQEDGYLVTILGLNLSEIIGSNPQNKIALQFYQAYLLLTLDWEGMDNYALWHRDNLKEPLPERIQEALVSLAQGDPERCKAYGVGEKVMQHYRKLQQGAMPSHYARSFWKYLYDHGVKF